LTCSTEALEGTHNNKRLLSSSVVKYAI
jgi:hypothetical protein